MKELIISKKRYRCTECGKTKPVSDFFLKRNWRYPELNTRYPRTRCKKCFGLATRKYVESYAKRFPEKIEAHTKVHKAVKDGTLLKQPCVFCGEKRVTGHHEDYSKPLKVVWLCYAHHSDLHFNRVSLVNI